MTACRQGEASYPFIWLMPAFSGGLCPGLPLVLSGIGMGLSLFQVIDYSSSQLKAESQGGNGVEGAGNGSS